MFSLEGFDHKKPEKILGNLCKNGNVLEAYRKAQEVIRKLKNQTKEPGTRVPQRVCNKSAASPKHIPPLESIHSSNIYLQVLTMCQAQLYNVRDTVVNKTDNTSILMRFSFQ